MSKTEVFKKFGPIQIDDARINETCNAYFKWKDLNTYISNCSHRGINMPDAISEPMGCYCLNLLWNRGNEVGDATDTCTKERIEMKRVTCEVPIELYNRRYEASQKQGMPMSAYMIKTVAKAVQEELG